MSYLYVLLAISFAISALGWIYFIYFFSIGYGFAISALSVAVAIIFHDVITWPALLLCAVLFVYGVRLGLFLLLREKRSASYKKILYQPENTTKKPVFVMMMCSPLRRADKSCNILSRQPPWWTSRERMVDVGWIYHSCPWCGDRDGGRCTKKCC